MEENVPQPPAVSPSASPESMSPSDFMLSSDSRTLCSSSPETVKIEKHTPSKSAAIAGRCKARVQIPVLSSASHNSSASPIYSASHVGGVTYDTFKTGLRLGVAVSEVFPPAKGVISGIVAISNILEDTKDNKSSVRITKARLERLQDIIGQDQHAQERFEAVVEPRFHKIYQGLESMSSQGLFGRIVTSHSDKERLKAYVGEIRDLVTEIHLDLSVATHSGIVGVHNVLSHAVTASRKQRRQFTETVP